MKSLFLVCQWVIRGELATVNFVGVFLFLKASAARFSTAMELTKIESSSVWTVRTGFFT